MVEPPDTPATRRSPPIPNTDDEATVILRRPPDPQPRPRLPLATLLSLLTCAILVLIAGWMLLRPADGPSPAPSPARSDAAPASPASSASVARAPVDPPASPSPPVASPAAEARIADIATLATEAEIARHRADRLGVFRLAENPRIIVLDYPSLAEQGLALNRAAALVEKAGLPRDRVLNDAELEQAIARAGDTLETFYYGHDYTGGDLLRFFALADRDGIRLTAQEEALRRLLGALGVTAGAPPQAILTIVREDGPTVDGIARRVILRHELSHGEFFTNPAFAAYARDAWAHVLQPEERAAFTRLLGEMGYDTGNETLMANEMQAFLVFTADERFISPATLRLPEPTVRALRDRFIAGMPDGWLKRKATEHLP